MLSSDETPPRSGMQQPLARHPRNDSAGWAIRFTRLRVGRAICAPGDEVMPTLANMAEELLGRIQFCSQEPDLAQPAIDHRNAAGLVAVKNLADLRQTQTQPLSGMHDPQAMEMLLRVPAMS